ncbi:MAG TPA: hypothetical protein VKA88_04915 [Solirubrobacterales bacterium]|nr:hypothetical protein [Solirubrobacterales bacterium]
MQRPDRVLVVLLCETRAWKLTARSLAGRVLDPLHADLALCIGDREPPNPLHERAKFIWRAAEQDDWGDAYDAVAGHDRWRVLLKPRAQVFGGIRNPDAQEVGSGAIVLFFRHFLRESLEQARLLEAYDWVVITRSDLFWPVEHPSTPLLSNRQIYALDGEGYGGVGDRHFVVPQRHLRRFLSITAPIFDEPERLRRRLDRRSVAHDWPIMNVERLLAVRLKELGLWRAVRFLPYAPYAVRAASDATRWSEGVFDEEHGCYIKYPTELERSRIAQCFVGGQDSWREYLAPIRGLHKRRALRHAYRERGLFERPFRIGELHLRAARRGRHLAIKQRERRQKMIVEIGRALRRTPRIASMLDARVRRIERRAERRSAGWM